ncbi:MAG: ThiF family adenylyltransferase [Mangrovibacterium sp.]
MERFERQISLAELGAEGQQKLRSARILVAGAGGLGCPAILYLAGAGAGTIGIADGDRVNVSNLNRQVLFGRNDIGRFKASVAARFIHEHYPDVQAIAYNYPLTVENLPSLLREYDMVIDSTDNFAARYMINDATGLFHKPLVYGAVYKFEGQVALFNATNESANYRDLYPEIPASGEIPNCAESGVLGVLPGIIGIMQAAEAIKWITGIGKCLINRVLFYNLKDHAVYETVLSPQPHAHRKQPATLKDFQETDYEMNCAAGINVGWAIAFRSARHTPAIFVDIREPEEMPRWDDNRCLQIPIPQLLRQKEVLMRAERVFLFCQHGIRSLLVAGELRKILNTEKVYSIEGGIEHPASPVIKAY